MRKTKHSLNRLPSLPTIAVEVLNVFNDPEASIQEVAQLVQADPAMSSKLLMAVNSSRFGLAHEIADIRQAITLLGKAKVTPIVLGFSLASESITDDEDHAAHFQRFWLRSFAQATAGEVLGETLGPKFASECFTVNLLAGVGQLALMKHGVDAYLECVRRAAAEEASLEQIELEVYGTTSKNLALEMLEAAGLPAKCTRAISATIPGSEIPEDDSEEARLAQITCVAESFARFFCDSEKGVGIVMAQERLSQLEFLSLDIEALSTEVRVQLDNSASLFNIDPNSLPDPEELLQDALDQLSAFTESINSNTPAVPSELLAENGRLKRQVEDLVRQTSTDALTGIPNRAFFDRRLQEMTQQCLHNQCEMGVAVVDIDHFKQVNDRYGHQAGDHILQQVARALDRVTRTNEALARYGGEEFAVLLEDIKPGGMSVFGERLRSRIESLSICFDGHTIPLTVSIGIATAVPSSDTYGLQLFADADAALYQAKQGGRNRVVIASAEANQCDSHAELSHAVASGGVPLPAV